MAEDAHVLRGINWRETFPFTQIFRSFRVAIHPSKLVLALLALLSLYMGGRILDGLWPVSSRAVSISPRAIGGAASPSEVELYASRSGRNFDMLRTAQRDEVEHNYAANFLERNWPQGGPIEKDHAAALKMAKSAEGLGDVKERILAQRYAELQTIETARKTGLEAADKITDSTQRSDARKAVEQVYKDSLARTYLTASITYQEAKLIEGEGIFEQLYSYEVSQVNGVIYGVIGNNWLGMSGGDNAVLPSVARFFTVGPLWLVNAHTVYFILYGILFLIVWSIFGGAICRIAAVHVARDEKLSLREALKFSVGKFLSFIFAPIIPLVIVICVGLLVAICALFGNIPVLGPWLISILFFLALGAGFVMTLVLLGTIGGFNLMYPTIAVEGSDSFDAISRSFSYAYARPWRLIFYTVVAIIYGALTYLFVKLFIAIMLGLTHGFVSKGMFIDAYAGQPLWDALWSGPNNSDLMYNVDYLSLTVSSKIAAGILSFWIYFVIAMLGAYAISFYFSSNTIIYFLMRREVDATELDDVYLEQSEEEFDTTPAAGTPAPSGPTTVVATTEVIIGGVTAAPGTEPSSGSSPPGNPPV